MFYINFVLILGNHGNFIVIIIHCNLAIIIVIDCVKIVSQISDILLKQKKLVIIIVSYWLDMNIKTFSYSLFHYCSFRIEEDQIELSILQNQ